MKKTNKSDNGNFDGLILKFSGNEVLDLIEMMSIRGGDDDGNGGTVVVLPPPPPIP